MPGFGPKIGRHALVFSLNSFVAAMLAFYIAFDLDLQRPYWAMMTVYITSNPLAGSVRSKAVYRLAGTLIGALAVLVLVPNLVNAPLVLSLALALWVGGCLAVSLLDRTPRSYMLLLAGYTAAIIGFAAVDQPAGIFDLAVSRVEEISIGIVCATVVHSLFFPRPVGEAIRERLSLWLATADHWLIDLARGETLRESAADRRKLAEAASDIHIMAAHLPFDTSRLRDTSSTVIALHERMLQLIPVLSGVTDRLQALKKLGSLPEAARARLDAAANWVEAGSPHGPGLALAAEVEARAATREGSAWRDLLVASLSARLAGAVTALAESHALLRCLHDPAAPIPPDIAAAMADATRQPMHTDLGLALRSGATCVVAVMITCIVWIQTGWSDGAAAASFVAVFCALFASLDDPAPAIVYFGFASLVTLVLAAVYVFGIFPLIDGFPLLAMVLFPPLFVFGLIMGDPATTARGMPLAMTFGSALALQETENANFANWMNGNLAIYVGLFIALFFIRATRSMTAEVSVRRLQRQTRTGIARLALRGLAGAQATGFASGLVERLALLTPHLTPGAGEPANFASVLVDRLALLTPRLALDEEGGNAIAAEALRDLRVVMNMTALTTVSRELDAAGRAFVTDIMRGIGAYYDSLARSKPASAFDALLPRFDSALAALAAGHGAARHRAVYELVGTRCNLFPAAAPFVPQEYPA